MIKALSQIDNETNANSSNWRKVPNSIKIPLKDGFSVFVVLWLKSFALKPSDGELDRCTTNPDRTG